MEPTLETSLTYIEKLHRITQTLEKRFPNIICTCQHCDRLEFVSLLWQDGFDIPIWFAEDLAHALAD